MQVAEERSAGVEVSRAEAAQGSAADAASADFAAAITEAGAATGGAAGATVGAEDTVMAGGAGDLALAGRIGVTDGDIHMATTARGITGRAPIILTRTTVLLTIPKAIRILTTVTTILLQQIPTHGPSLTRMDLQDPGDPPYREAVRIQTTETATSRPLRRARQFSPLTG
jgi:hypothetical protein